MSVKTIIGKIIRTIFKIVGWVIAINIFALSMLAAMIYFSQPIQYNEWIEQGFAQTTGQKMKIIGDVNFAISKTLHATFNNTVLTLNTSAGKVDIQVKYMEMDVSWLDLLRQKVNDVSLRANDLVINTVMLTTLSCTFQRTCCDVTVPTFEAVLPKGKLTGNIKVQFLEPAWKVEGKILAPTWTLPQMPKNAIVAFSLPGLTKITGTLDFQADTLHTPQGVLQHATGLIDLGKKTLTIQSKHAILDHP